MLSLLEEITTDAQECCHTWWLLMMDRFYSKINWCSFMQHWQIIVSLSLIVGSFCYWSPSDIGCQLYVRTAAQVSWGILWLAPEGSHITGVRDCSVENVSRKRNMNWKSRSITSWRRNKLGLFFFFTQDIFLSDNRLFFAVKVRFFPQIFTCMKNSSRSVWINNTYSRRDATRTLPL